MRSAAGIYRSNATKHLREIENDQDRKLRRRFRLVRACRRRNADASGANHRLDDALHTNEDAGHWPAFLFAQCVSCGAKKFTTAHPKRAGAASQDQMPRTAPKETTMTKLLSITAAIVLFAPVAVAILIQAAQIVA